MTAPKQDEGGVKVTFARPYEIDGKAYKPDQDATVSREVAGELLHYGYAREADAPTTKES